jgi:hypothetical protein
MQNTPCVFVLCICNSNPMVGTRVRFSTILANMVKNIILIYGLNRQNTPTLCLCCVFVIVTQWLGQEFNSQQFCQIPIIKKFVLIFGLNRKNTPTLCLCCVFVK